MKLTQEELEALHEISEGANKALLKLLDLCASDQEKRLVQYQLGDEREFISLKHRADGARRLQALFVEQLKTLKRTDK